MIWSEIAGFKRLSATHFLYRTRDFRTRIDTELLANGLFLQRVFQLVQHGGARDRLLRNRGDILFQIGPERGVLLLQSEGLGKGEGIYVTYIPSPFARPSPWRRRTPRSGPI